ncbi:MAG TPA: S41 family peptidase, partial [Terriglobales bacterium]|nr:S41 family peptidase [Terriglobales bacterium]
LQKYVFFNFGKHYLIGKHIQKTFEVDEPVMQEFRKFLDEQKVPYTEAELIENDAWVRARIKSEIFVDEYGQQDGLKVSAEADPEVQKALDLLPKAKELAENARRIVADKAAARGLNR